ncbi:MAG: hypothetical protein JAZ05_14820 [Candidatus Thiodiazotropha taylori]|nr:hypothetical protein [Candidatus Thiodiazotropha taylori]
MNRFTLLVKTIHKEELRDRLPSIDPCQGKASFKNTSLFYRAIDQKSVWLDQLGVVLSFQRQDSSDSLPIQTGFVIERIFDFCVNKAIS